MTPIEFATAMRAIREQNEKGGDHEQQHIDADKLMLLALRELGYGEGCDEFDLLEIWYA